MNPNSKKLENLNRVPPKKTKSFIKDDFPDNNTQNNKKENMKINKQTAKYNRINL